jgi:hypothetical protein
MKIEDSSFRDHSGFVFYENNEVYRQINPVYFDNYNFLMKSGLYNELVSKKYLIEHEEISNDTSKIIVKAKKINFISYPYEWSFYQLKRAALLTLEIQKICLKYGMSLKDASAFNIQFVDAKPLLIDTLSFEQYKENKPWVAYRQFCQHFLSPLALAIYGKNNLSKLSALYIDGISLELTSKLLPIKSYFNVGIYSHIHLNAKFEKKFNATIELDEKKLTLSIEKQKKIIDHLKSIITEFKLPRQKSNWTDYYEDFSYDKENIEDKKSYIEFTLKKIQPTYLIDSGSNTGMFSEIGSKFSNNVISFDFDETVIHNQCKNIAKKSIKNILPLVVDMTCPTPAIGWENKERKSFIDRLPENSCTLSLALIHHLVLSFNLTFEKIAKFYSSFSKDLIIEFVPKNDSQSQRLLVTKEDLYENYTKENFEKVFGNYFKLVDSKKISNSERILYHYERIF